jgi:hypothetical protein
MKLIRQSSASGVLVNAVLRVVRRRPLVQSVAISGGALW